MEVKVRALMLALGSLIATARAQNFTPGAGLLRATATLTPAYAPVMSGGRVFLHGFAEFFVADRISLSGDGYLHIVNMHTLASWQNKRSHGLFFGGYYHWIRGGHEVYTGFQPGLQFGYLEYFSQPGFRESRPFPSVALVAGYTFQLNRWFHFFVQPRFVYGRMTNGGIADFSDFRLSAGLGFHLSSARRESRQPER